LFKSVFSDITSTTGIDANAIEAWHVDFTKFETISGFADRFEKEGGGHLDLLVMNIGIQSWTTNYTQDRWESV